MWSSGLARVVLLAALPLLLALAALLAAASPPPCCANCAQACQEGTYWDTVSSSGGSDSRYISYPFEYHEFKLQAAKIWFGGNTPCLCGGARACVNASLKPGEGGQIVFTGTVWASARAQAPHCVPSYRVFHAAHGLKIEVGIYKFDAKKPESDFF
jgi:hypothetical protein